MVRKVVTTRTASPWRLTAQEVAHALPVLQWAHPRLVDLPAPRLATIRLLAERHGVRDGALRTALSRACAAGSLVASDGRYRVGPRSEEEAAAARALRSRRPGYVVVVIAEGEHADLPALREVLTRVGLRPLQRSVWVGARATEDHVGAALRRAGLSREVVVFHADEVDDDARGRLAKLWGLAARARTLRRFHHQLVTWLRAPSLTPSEAAWRCVEVAPVWYRVAIQEEPPFPLVLLGDRYPLDGLHADWRSHLATTTTALAALWRGHG